jgi:predicted AAA+ superfamily ATPase
MTVELFKIILSEFLEEPLETGTIRELRLPLDNQSITTVIGGRRTGKTTLLKQTINELIRDGTPKENIVYINFEDERIPRESHVFQDLLQAQAELHSEIDTNMCWYFFDKIYQKTS